MEIYTYWSNPFRFGGNLQEFIKTNVEEFERVSIGKGYYGILIKNSSKPLYHMALEGCGAIIGTDTSKEELITRVKNDVETGDKAIMQKQIEQAVDECAKATLLDPRTFFVRFKL